MGRFPSVASQKVDLYHRFKTWQIGFIRANPLRNTMGRVKHLAVAAPQRQPVRNDDQENASELCKGHDPKVAFPPRQPETENKQASRRICDSIGTTGISRGNSGTIYTPG
jgi:hypothetical protein